MSAIQMRALDKPAVAVNWTRGYTKVVGERVEATIPMKSDALQSVEEAGMHHWKFHDALYHADEGYPNESCEVCEEYGEVEL